MLIMLRPEARPLTLFIPFLAGKVPLSYTLQTQSFPVIFRLRSIIKTIGPYGMCVRNILIKCPLKYLNDRFPFPFHFHLKPRTGGSVVEHWAVTREVVSSTLKILSRKCCLCNHISKWFYFQVFSDKDYKPEVPSHKP